MAPSSKTASRHRNVHDDNSLNGRQAPPHTSALATPTGTHTNTNTANANVGADVGATATATIPPSSNSTVSSMSTMSSCATMTAPLATAMTSSTSALLTPTPKSKDKSKSKSKSKSRSKALKTNTNINENAIPAQAKAHTHTPTSVSVSVSVSTHSSASPAPSESESESAFSSLSTFRFPFRRSKKKKKKKQQQQQQQNNSINNNNNKATSGITSTPKLSGSTSISSQLPPGFYQLVLFQNDSSMTTTTSTTTTTTATTKNNHTNPPFSGETNNNDIHKDKKQRRPATIGIRLRKSQQGRIVISKVLPGGLFHQAILLQQQQQGSNKNWKHHTDHQFLQSFVGSVLVEVHTNEPCPPTIRQTVDRLQELVSSLSAASASTSRSTTTSSTTSSNTIILTLAMTTCFQNVIKTADKLGLVLIQKQQQTQKQDLDDDDDDDDENHVDDDSGILIKSIAKDSIFQRRNNNREDESTDHPNNEQSSLSLSGLELKPFQRIVKLQGKSCPLTVLEVIDVLKSIPIGQPIHMECIDTFRPKDKSKRITSTSISTPPIDPLSPPIPTGAVETINNIWTKIEEQQQQDDDYKQKVTTTTTTITPNKAMVQRFVQFQEDVKEDIAMSPKTSLKRRLEYHHDKEMNEHHDQNNNILLEKKTSSKSLMTTIKVEKKYPGQFVGLQVKAQRFNFNHQKMFVESIDPQGIFANSGLCIGHEIISINCEPCPGTADEVSAVCNEAPLWLSLQVANDSKYRRQQQKQSKESTGTTGTVDNNGVTVSWPKVHRTIIANMTPTRRFLGLELVISSQNAVCIGRIDSTGIFSDKGLIPGDRIVSINGMICPQNIPKALRLLASQSDGDVGLIIQRTCIKIKFSKKNTKDDNSGSTSSLTSLPLGLTLVATGKEGGSGLTIHYIDPKGMIGINQTPLQVKQVLHSINDIRCPGNVTDAIALLQRLVQEKRNETTNGVGGDGGVLQLIAVDGVEPTWNNDCIVTSSILKESSISSEPFLGIQFQMLEEDDITRENEKNKQPRIVVSRIDRLGLFASSFSSSSRCQDLEVGQRFVSIHGIHTPTTPEQIIETMRTSYVTGELTLVTAKMISIVYKSTRSTSLGLTLAVKKNSHNNNDGDDTGGGDVVVVVSMSKSSLFQRTMLRPGQRIVSMNGVRCNGSNIKETLEMLQDCVGKITVESVDSFPDTKSSMDNNDDGNDDEEGEVVRISFDRFKEKKKKPQQKQKQDNPHLNDKETTMTTTATTTTTKFSSSSSSRLGLGLRQGDAGLGHVLISRLPSDDGHGNGNILCERLKVGMEVLRINDCPCPPKAEQAAEMISKLGSIIYLEARGGKANK